MSLQRFKTHVAGAVVNAENASLQSMSTEEAPREHTGATPRPHLGYTSATPRLHLGYTLGYTSADTSAAPRPHPGGCDRSSPPTQVLDLFELWPATTAAGAAPSAQAYGGGGGGGGGGDGGSGGRQSLLSNVGSLWGAEEYEEEYDLDEFLDQLS